jgi:DNA-binding CsgD family transcriptional regulator
MRPFAQVLGNREIAERLNLSEHIANNYMLRLFDMLGICHCRKNSWEWRVKIPGLRAGGFCEYARAFDSKDGGHLPLHSSPGALCRSRAEQLNLSEHTVKNYMSHIFDKLGISNRVELALYAASNSRQCPASAVLLCLLVCPQV